MSGITTISNDTKIHLGLVVAIVTTIIGVSFGIKDAIAEQTTKLLLVEQRLGAIEERVGAGLEVIQEDFVSRNEFTVLWSALKESNPDIIVPSFE